MISKNIQNILENTPKSTSLIVVSKTKSNEEILEVYSLGFRVFGENKVQEITRKYQELPKDILWHMIGHLQTNKVKFIAPFIELIHSVDSLKLLKEINKQARKNNRKINCLLQIKISLDESKYGMSKEGSDEILKNISDFENVNILGFMGMASLSSDSRIISSEFASLKEYFDLKKNDFHLEILSMGMSGDYQLAVNNGSNMIRVGSKIFKKTS